MDLESVQVLFLPLSTLGELELVHAPLAVEVPERILDEGVDVAQVLLLLLALLGPLLGLLYLLPWLLRTAGGDIACRRSRSDLMGQLVLLDVVEVSRGLVVDAGSGLARVSAFT